MSGALSWLREPWTDALRQREAAVFGIWVFLASEVLFFGALILTYAAGRIAHPNDFAAAARETDLWFGTANTAVLLTSSFTMAVASQAATLGHARRRLVANGLAATAVLGLVFLVIKGFEYAEDIGKRLVPGPDFAPLPHWAQVFFALYWVLTGVHAVHVAIGIGLTSRLGFAVATRRTALRDNPQIEVAALYWHLVDLVWIFLYPLIYLPGRAP